MARSPARRRRAPRPRKGHSSAARSRPQMAAKKAAKKAEPPKKAVPKEPARKPAEPKKAPAKKAAKPPVHKEKVVVPHDVYEAHKDELKAPLKEKGLKWSYLGEDAQGKRGLYKATGVNVFAHFKDDGVHYDVWGDDKAAVADILKAWRGTLGAKLMDAAKSAGADAAVVEQAEQESEALKLWRLQEPQRRPGEPDFFYNKRRVEWEAAKPSA